METTSAEEQQPRREPEIYIGRHNASIEAISIGETDVNLSKDKDSTSTSIDSILSNHVDLDSRIDITDTNNKDSKLKATTLHDAQHREDILDNFLTRPSIAPHEVDAVRNSIETALLQALEIVEKGGKEAFDLHTMQERRRKNSLTSKSIYHKEYQRALEEAEIHGNPRDYQAALFEAAKKRNTIVNLGTGQGKTMIALLTIQHFAFAYEEGKQTLFMVPSVPLCIQQSMTLQANLPYSTKMAYADVSHSYTTLQELANANILVATHGAIHEMLMHYGDIFQMERFNLLVFDECHYASGNHDYKIIMEKFYHVLPKDKRPHVLGLTASPLLNVRHTHNDGQLGRMLTALETTLDAKVVSLRDLVVTDTRFVQQHVEEKHVFFQTTYLPQDFPSHEHVGLHQARLREFQQLNHIYQDLGPLSCSIYCQTLIQEVSCNEYEQETSHEFRSVVNHLQSIANYCDNKTKICPHGGRTEKLLKLERLLEECIEFQGDKDTVGLVFVERRITAMALHNLLLHRQQALDAENWRRASDMVDLPPDDDCTPLSTSSPTALAVQSKENSHRKTFKTLSSVSRSVPHLTNCQSIQDDEELYSDADALAIPLKRNSQSNTTNSFLSVSASVPHPTLCRSIQHDEDQFANAEAFSKAAKEMSHGNKDNEFLSVFGAVPHPKRRYRPIQDDEDKFVVTGDFPMDSEDLSHSNKLFSVSGAVPHSTECLQDTKALLHHSRDNSQSSSSSLSVFGTVPDPCQDDEDQFADAEDLSVQFMDNSRSKKQANTFLSVAELMPHPTIYGPIQDDDDQFADADELELHETFSMSQASVPVQGHKSNIDDSHSVISGQFSDVDEEFGLTNIAKRDFIDKIRCDVLVRQSTQIFKYLRSGKNRAIGSDKKKTDQEMNIRNILSSLKRREFNLLIATSVVDEGVDIQACSFIVVFDQIRSTKGYIQMKGRARRNESEFFVFENQADSSSTKSRQLSLKTSQQAEKRVNDFIENRELPPNSTLISYSRLNPKHSCCTVDEEIRAVEKGEYKTAHAVVDLRSAKALLNKYALTVPLDASARKSRESYLLNMPTFEEFQLILPSHLPPDVRVIELPSVYQAAQRGERHHILALMACVRLHKLHLLNERLLPLTRIDLCEKLLNVVRNEFPPFMKGDMHSRGLAIGEQKEIFAYPIVQFGVKMNAFRKILKGDLCSLVVLSVTKIKGISAETYKHPEIGEIIFQLGSERKQTLTMDEWALCSNFFAILFQFRWSRKSKQEWFRPRSWDVTQDVLPPYTVGILNINGQLDWEYMRRTINESSRDNEQCFNACQSYSVNDTDSKPRLCGTAYNPNVTYIVHGPVGLDCSARFPGKLGGVDTFRDYYKQIWNITVSMDTPLLLAQPLWFLPVKPLSCDSVQTRVHQYNVENYYVQDGTLGDKHVETIGELATVLLPQTVCSENFLGDASLALLTVMLPQFLHNVDRHLISQVMVKHCLINLPSLGAYLQDVPVVNIIEALTAKGADLERTYDQLEWVGDSVLKLVQTDAILNNPELQLWVQNLHEGDLTMLRSAICNNKFLCNACQQVGIDRFIHVTPLARGKWIPVNLELHYYGGSEIRLPYEASPSMKVCADVIESLLGMIYLKFGYSAAVEVAQEFGVSLHVAEKLSAQKSKLHVTPRRLLMELVSTLTRKISFENPGLVEEALTHCSALCKDVSSYQKLEWVGDAALCIAVREWIYTNYPNVSVGDMVTMEAALVSNEILAYQSVKTGLHKFIIHRDQYLPPRLEHYAWSIEGGRRGIWGTDPPKILSDVVESVLGAVHMDGGFDEGQTAVLSLMAPILKAMKETQCAKLLTHPKTSLNELGGLFLRINVTREDSFSRSRIGLLSVWQGQCFRDADFHGSDYVATVSSIGIDLISVAEPSKKAARNRACALVVAVLLANPSLLERLTVISRIVYGGHALAEQQEHASESEPEAK